MKKILLIVISLAVFVALFWFFVLPSLQSKGPSNPPTADELKRIQAIEESSSKIAPNAVPGAGVRPVGSLPKTPEPAPQSTTSESTTTKTDLPESE